MKYPNRPDFHCHVQSLDSASTPESFIKRELELGTGAITCTDHGTLAACRKVYDLAKAANITPILGIEGYVRDDSCPIFLKHGISKNAEGNYKDYFKYGHITLQCLDYEAYLALVKTISDCSGRAEQHGSETKPIFTWKDLEFLGSKNITGGSGCLIGICQRHLLDNNNPDIAQDYYKKVKSCFKPGNFYVEVFPHVCDNNFVAGLYVTMNNGDKLKVHNKKTFKTNVGEIQAADLLKKWSLKDKGGHNQIIAVKNRKIWSDINQGILNVEYIEEFIDNEPCTWAPDGDVQKGANKFMLYLAEKFNDPVVISQDSHMAYAVDKPVQDVRLMAGGGSWRFSNVHYRMSSDDMFPYFKDQLGWDEKRFEKALDTNAEWASRFKGFEFKKANSLPVSFYPKDTLIHLQFLIKKHGRMKWDKPEYVERLNKEIELFKNNGTLDLLSYFFLAEEICSRYQEMGLLSGPGRGSAAGCLIAYLLSITHLDPLEFNLSLERFLTLDRIKSGKLPDIDMDFEDREPLVNPETGFLTKRFGDCFAQLSTDTLLKLKSSIKDVARVKYKKVPDDIEILTKQMKVAPQGLSDRDFIFGYEGDGGWEKGSIEYDEALKEYIKKYPEDFEVVKLCLGVGRQRSRHPSAFIIADTPIQNFIPTMNITDVRCTQYTADSVEAVGGLKMDILVVNSLSDISSCVKMIQSNSGLEIPNFIEINGEKVPKIRIVPHKGKFMDVWKLYESPWTKDVYEDVSSGNTETIFQYNSGGAVKWLKYFNFKDKDGNKILNSLNKMAAFTALDRPGPLDIELITPEESTVNALQEYSRRARGMRPSETLPILDKLFPETYGMMIYQEQVKDFYQYVTDCSSSDAENFRSDVSKKKKEKIVKAYPKFVEKASEKIGAESAEKAWNLLTTWANYGFNSAHAHCYADIGLACAYFKHHFPLEWWTAVLQNAKKNEINQTFWIHCGQFIELPDINKSDYRFVIENGKIRAPISLLDGIGESAHKQIVDDKPYTDIYDFCRKYHKYKIDNAKTVEVFDKKTNQKVIKKKMGHSSITRTVVHKLIVCGVMDSIFPKTVEEGGVSYELSVADKIRIFEKAFAETKDEISPTYTPKGKQKTTAPLKVDEKYLNINEIDKYQIIKEIMPAYSANLTQLLFERGNERIKLTPSGFRYKSDVVTDDIFTFVNFLDMKLLESVDPFPIGGLSIAITAYVEESRLFKYSNQTKEACSLVLDIGGGKCQTVKWPNYNGKLDKEYKQDLKGSIVLALLTKTKEDKPFFIQEIEIVVKPLEAKKEGDPDA